MESGKNSLSGRARNHGNLPESHYEKAESNHKYDTTDYTVIDPHFGTEEEFKDLVEEAHQHGFGSWWMPCSIIVEESLHHGWMF